MFSYLFFFQALVLLGATGLVLALLPAYRLINGLPDGDIKTRWKVLFGLIVTLFIGYIVVLFSLSGMPSDSTTHILVFILFGGGIFVWVLCHLSVNTLNMAVRLVELEQETIQDPLMDIYNRRHLDIRLQEEFKRARRYKSPLAYMMLDVDHFKKINDKFGHDIGDNVLVEMAKILKRQARDTDVVARYGGEEVGIICPQTDAKGGKVFAERMRLCIDEELTVCLDKLRVTNGLNYDSDVHNITVSIGVACINDDIQDAFDFIKQADKALYQAKNNGRNQVVTTDECKSQST